MKERVCVWERGKVSRERVREKEKMTRERERAAPHLRLLLGLLIEKVINRRQRTLHVVILIGQIERDRFLPKPRLDGIGLNHGSHLMSGWTGVGGISTSERSSDGSFTGPAGRGTAEAS